MIQLAVKLGDLAKCLNSKFESFAVFSNEKSGGPDPDRTGDLLHAMQEEKSSISPRKYSYLTVRTKEFNHDAANYQSGISAHERSRTQAKEGETGGKIGVRQGIISVSDVGPKRPAFPSYQISISNFQLNKNINIRASGDSCGENQFRG